MVDCFDGGGGVGNRVVVDPVERRMRVVSLGGGLGESWGIIETYAAAKSDRRSNFSKPW